MTPKEGEEESSTTPKKEPHLGKGGMELTFLRLVGCPCFMESGLAVLLGVGLPLLLLFLGSAYAEKEGEGRPTQTPRRKGNRQAPPNRREGEKCERRGEGATPLKGGRRSCPLGGVALSSSAWVVLPPFPWGGCYFHSFFGVVLFFPLPPLGGVPLPLWAVLL